MQDEGGASNPLSFVVAGSLIIGIIGVALVTTGGIGGGADVAPSHAANQQAQAENMAALLLDAPPSSVPGARLSLKQADGSALDLATFRQLQLTKFTADPTDVKAYDQVKAQFGLPPWQDFHIRSYPTLEADRQALGDTKDPNLKVVYVGHAETKFSGGAPTVGPIHCSASPWDTDSIRFSTDIKNTGNTSTQFQLVLGIDNGPGRNLLIRDQTGLLAAGQTTTLRLDVPHTSAAACSGTTKIDVSLYGTSRRLVNLNGMPAATTAAPATVAEGIPLLMPSSYTVAGDPIVVEYTADKDDKLHWELHEGAAVTPSTPALVTSCGSLSPCKGNHTVPNKGSSFSILSPTVTLPTTYTLVVKHEQHGATATQRVLVVPSASSVQPFTQQSGSSSFHFDEAMVMETDMVEALAEKFDPRLHDDTGSATSPAWEAECEALRAAGTRTESCVTWPGTGGDVFWDEKKVLTQALPERIRFLDTATCTPAHPDTMPDIIVVGSNVDHNAMTSGNFKMPLKDWVICGGLLIVFGSPEASTQWLQPIFHVGAQTVTGGISAPDPTHPLLRVPNQLDFEAYDHQGRTWRYTANAGDYFTNIVNQGSDPITAISDPGDFGRGTVLISNWLPYDLFGAGPGSAHQEGLHIMDNFLTQAYRDLFLDYGPQIPSGSPVVPAIRHSQVELSSTFGDANYHPMCKNSGRCHVDMTVLLFLF